MKVGEEDGEGDRPGTEDRVDENRGRCEGDGAGDGVGGLGEDDRILGKTGRWDEGSGAGDNGEGLAMPMSDSKDSTDFGEDEDGDDEDGDDEDGDDDDNEDGGVGGGELEEDGFGTDGDFVSFLDALS